MTRSKRGRWVAKVGGAVQVMAAQSAFRSDFNEEASCIAALDAQMRHCALTMAMMDSRLFSEAGAVICRIAMIGHAHMLSFCQVWPACTHA